MPPDTNELKAALPSWEAEREVARRAQQGDSAALDSLIAMHEGHLKLRLSPLAPALAESALHHVRAALRENFAAFDVDRGYRFNLWYSSFVAAAVQHVRGLRPAAPPIGPSADPARDAREGNVAALAALADDGRAREAWLWLCASDDAGHDDARGCLDDLLESDFRHDDDGYERAAAHWELAVAYLEGTRGLSRDVSLASKHFLLALSVHSTFQALSSGTDVGPSPEALLARADDAGAAVLRALVSRAP